jgi:hexosaminidase
VTSVAPSSDFISLKVNNSNVQTAEGYTLKVTPKAIEIESHTANGAFYAIQSLLQLLPPQIEGFAVASVTWNVPCVSITDAPRFPYRGMHLDVCRHFFSVDFIKKQLDVMAMYKLNTFHWHLTEDQGWRIEIKKYPKLTELGSKRLDGEGTVSGGFYTQEQIKEVVQYAKDRFINVLPEIELPGHALAALTAYPQYSCTGGPFQVRNKWGVEDDVYCAGNEETFQFIDDIIKEVVALFPYEYFHIGGDECPKVRWKECPKCQARIKAEGLANEHELQSYFVKRVEKMLQAKGKKMIGWDEILEGGLAASATVMSWRGEEGGIAAASQNHDVIMTPGNWVYLDKFQGSSKVEPVEIGGLLTLEQSYGYDPVSKKIPADKQHFVLGAQGNIWSEYAYTPEKVEYQVYPRIIALAEVNWSQLKNKNYDDFLRRMNNQFTRLDFHHINYHIPLPEGPANFVAFVDTVTLRFSTTRPVKMVYSMDGTEPDSKSQLYTKGILLSKSTTLKIRSVLPTGQMSTIRTITAEKQSFAIPKNSQTQPGLVLKRTSGIFLRVADVNKATVWTDTIVEKLKLKFDVNSPSAAIYTGFIEVPENAVYYFSTDMDQLLIAGKLVVNNDGEVKRFSRNDGSIALAKGKHEFKLVFLNNNIGGFPSSWNEIKVLYRASSETKFNAVSSSMLSH